MTDSPLLAATWRCGLFTNDANRSRRRAASAAGLLLGSLLISHLTASAATAARIAPVHASAREHAQSHTSVTLAARESVVLQSRRAGLASQLSMRVEAGWNDRYRANPAWTPVRVTFQNRGNATISGRAEIPDTTIFGALQTGQPASARYGTAVILPPQTTKRITLYLPGIDLPGAMTVEFQADGRVLRSATVYPNRFQDREISIGALTGDPASVSWLQRLRLTGAAVRVIPLKAATLDTIPEVLANFDLIVLTNVDTSQLDRDQVVALERYVRDGGSLLLVGGLACQGTLRPLPRALVPGEVAGSRPLPDLNGLRSLTIGVPPIRPTSVCLLHGPRGAVLAAEAGIPLVVRAPLGNGEIEFLSFDPASDPILHWPAAPTGLAPLLLSAVPQAIRRLSLPPTYASVSFLRPAPGPIDLAQELGNSAAHSRLPIALLIALATLYVLLLGPLSALLLRRARQIDRQWAIIPAVGLLCTGVTLLASARGTGSAPLLNTIGAVEVDGSGNRYPADVYVGVSVPAASATHLIYGAPALPAPILPEPSYGPRGPSATSLSPWIFQEGTQTRIDFLPNSAASNRAVALRTTVEVAGSISTRLQLDRAGDIVGTIQNRTPLDLIHPALVAGRAVAILPDLPPRHTVRVRLQPANDVHHHTYGGTLFAIYGQSPLGGPNTTLPAESSLTAQVRNVLSALPETNVLSMLGEVVFLAWTEQPLSAVSLNGAIPEDRSLTLLVKPLAVNFPTGRFRLHTGTLGASFLDETPSRPRYACCGPTAQGIYLGVGGSATFAFDIPRPGHTHFLDLVLSAWGGGPDTSFNGYTDMPSGAVHVFDWQTGRWEGVQFQNDEAALHHPDRFVSATGALLVKLQAISDAHELAIADPHQDLQLSGLVEVR